MGERRINESPLFPLCMYSSPSFFLAMATSQNWAVVCVLFVFPSLALSCHSTTIVKQIGSPYSAEESADVAKMVDALPPNCNPSGTGVSGQNGNTR